MNLFFVAGVSLALGVLFGIPAFLLRQPFERASQRYEMLKAEMARRGVGDFPDEEEWDERPRLWDADDADRLTLMNAWRERQARARFVQSLPFGMLAGGTLAFGLGGLLLLAMTSLVWVLETLF